MSHLAARLRRIAAALVDGAHVLRALAAGLSAAADALELEASEEPRSKGLAIEESPADVPPALYVESGSAMDRAHQTLAELYLGRALTRFSPRRPPSA